MKKIAALLFIVLPLLAACGSNGTTSDVGDTGNDVAADVSGTDAFDANTGDAMRDGGGDSAVDVSGDSSGDDVSDATPDTDGAIETDSSEQCPYPTKIEIEAAAETGINDEFSKAQPIMLGEDVTGYLSTDMDIDWFKFCVPADGIVNVHIDFTDSFDASGIYSMLFAAYTDEWLASNVAAAGSHESGDCFEAFPLKACLKTIDLKMSVLGSQNVYAFRVSGGADYDGLWAGFDQSNPYTVRIDFVPGDDLEADQPVVDGAQNVGSVDTWRTAADLLLDANGLAEVETYGWYWNDIDWYRVHLEQPGWVRIVAQIEPVLDNMGYPLFMNDGSLIRMGENGPEEIEDELSWAVPYNGSCGINRSETTVFGGADYYVRVSTSPAVQDHTYRFVFEYGPGAVEDGQPDVDGVYVGAAEDSSEAMDLGELDVGDTITVGSYFWHYFDFDWYKFTVPADAGQLVQVKLDYTEMYNALGWYGCPDNENGIEVWMYMFESTSLDYPGIAQGYEDDVPTQSITWTVEGGKTYYINVMSRENWDQSNPYTLTISPAA